MDTQLMTQLLALLTGAWTLYQEVRHRKNAKKEKAVSDSMADALGAKPMPRGKK